MESEILTIILTTLLGGLNVFQLLWWRAEKKKHQAEADSASVDAKQKGIDLQQDQYDFLLEKLSKYQQDYFELADKMKETTDKHTGEIQEVNQKFSQIIYDKCNEIAELKSKIIYFKGLRCYKSDCSLRIKFNPKDVQNGVDNQDSANQDNA